MSAAHAGPLDIEAAVRILDGGGLVAFPTETVYGLGADAASDTAVLAIYETKGRPRFNPLIVHCASREMAGNLVEFPPLAEHLTRFWPGPLTLVLPKKKDAPVSDLVSAGLDTVAVRVPGLALARDLIGRVGRPLAAPSANPSGRLSPTGAGQVRDMLGDAVPVLDGGPCLAGLESTIVALAGDQAVQLRAGALPREEIEAVMGMKLAATGKSGAVIAPGMLKSHYAPRAALRLNAAGPRPGEAYLAFGPGPKTPQPTRNLSPIGDVREAARNLFAFLHALDAGGAAQIAVAPIPHTGLGEAINDRLQRAAAPRGS